MIYIISYLQNLKAKYMGVLDSMPADSTEHDDSDVRDSFQVDQQINKAYIESN